MRIAPLFERIIHYSTPTKSIATTVFLFPFFLLSLLYGTFVRLRCWLYRSGILSSFRPPCHIISVGNITVGGTGKTPTVLYLAQLSRAAGKKTVVLSRGYKGKRSKNCTVVSDGNHLLLEVKDAGDEPYLLARALPGIPVIIGKDRVRSCQYACQHFSAEVIILDDGFQYLPLQRDADLLLVDLISGFGNGYLLPRGILREPLAHLSRAHLFLLTKKMEEEAIPPLVKIITSYKPDALIFFAWYEIKSFTHLSEGKELNPDSLKGKKVAAISGIANHRYFSYLLQQYGLIVARERQFPDHYTYTPRDAKLFTQCLTQDVEYIITTTKDSVKMDPEYFKNLPILVSEIVLKIQNEQLFKDIFLKYILSS